MIARRRLIGAAAVMIAAIWSAAAQAQVDPRATAALGQMDAWLRSVVYIRISCPGATYPSVGTGVLIRGTGEVLTAAHVGSDCPAVTTARMGRIRSLYSAPGTELTATLKRRISDNRATPDQAQIRSAEFQDLALWKIDNLTDDNLVPAKMATAFPMPGEPIEVAGFSGLPYWHGLNGTAGANAGPGLTRFRISLASVGASAQDVPYRLNYIGGTLAGVSGGPVFNAAGDLLGIHSTRTTQLIKDTMMVGCTAGKDHNCVEVMVPSTGSSSARSTIGLGILGMKGLLENYSWATSIFAIPSGWLVSDDSVKSMDVSANRAEKRRGMPRPGFVRPTWQAGRGDDTGRG